MSRPSVTVRTATPQDAPVLVELWAELRELSGRQVPPPAPEQVVSRLERFAQDPDSRVVVAVCEESVVGLAVYTLGIVSPLIDATAVNITYLHVCKGARRRGIGRALVASAAAFADETGAENVVVNVLPQLREANRFYARLGFGALVVRRVAPTSVLRRRLAADRDRALCSTEVVGRRRRLQALTVRSAVTRAAER